MRRGMRGRRLGLRRRRRGSKSVRLSGSVLFRLCPRVAALFVCGESQFLL